MIGLIKVSVCSKLAIVLPILLKVLTNIETGQVRLGEKSDEFVKQLNGVFTAEFAIFELVEKFAQ